MTDARERLIDELDAMVSARRHGCDTIPLDDIEPGSDHPLAGFVKRGFTQLEVFLTDSPDPSLAVEFSVPLTLPSAPHLRDEFHGKPVEGITMLVGVGMEGRERVMLYDGERETWLDCDPVHEDVWKAIERLHVRLLEECRARLEGGYEGNRV